MKSIYWSVTIMNIIVMICWTAMAIYFGKWWIALFAVLCLRCITWERK